MVKNMATPVNSMNRNPLSTLCCNVFPQSEATSVKYHDVVEKRTQMVVLEETLHARKANPYQLASIPVKTKCCPSMS